MTSTDFERKGTLRMQGPNGTARYLTTPQKLMIFVLSMSLFGLSNIILEIIPDPSIGPIDIGVSYMVFVLLAMSGLFSPFWAALGAPLGEIIFTDLLMGDFSGLAEIEGYLQMFLAVYIGGSLLRNPRSTAQIWLASITIVLVDKVLSGIVDLAKVWIGVEDAEYVEGLPESVLAIEVIGLGVDVIMSGILLGAIPAMWLIPKLHRRIEPLMGMEPREPGRPIAGAAPKNITFVIGALVLSVASFGFAFMEAYDINAGVWEPEFLDEYGPGFIMISVAAIVIVLTISIVLFRKAQKRSGKAVADESAADQNS